MAQSRDCGLVSHAGRIIVLIFLVLVFLPTGSAAVPVDVSFSPSAETIEAYDFLEVTLHESEPAAKNPFNDVTVEGRFGKAGENKPLSVEGFCDSADGTVFRIRFMPSSPGDYAYTITYREGDFTKTHAGTFRATDGHRRGVLRVDPQYPWHFIWEGTGEHYFWNGTTAFYLMAWTDERIITGILERLHALKVNRIRALLAGRSATYWGEPIIPTREFRPYLNPWVAAHPEDVTHPEFDYRRFNVAYYQKWERMLRAARERDMIISVVFDWNDSSVHPAALSEDELRYFHYTAVRLGAFSNVTWDLGDDISSYRSLDWSHQIGTRLEQWDAYKHLASDHPVDNTQQDRTADWFGFTSFQWWPRPLHDWMLNQRQAQAAAGRIIPQVDEEYGYEDHYPLWSPSYPDGASADANRRAAWEMSMAGTYQTTGETAKRGTGVWPDTGGGWVNGRGDRSMVMLEGYAHMVDFFTRFDWWKTEPHDELVTPGNFCLADPGKTYAVYLPMAGKVSVKLEPDRYRASWFNARTGERTPLAEVEGPNWTSPRAPDSGDWALLLEKE